MKPLMLVICLMVLPVSAIPSSNNYAAVTNDWYNANFTNVYDLALFRLSGNSNDVVAAYVMLEYAISFQDSVAVSNQINNVVFVSDQVTNAVFSVPYQVLRPYFISYRDNILSSLPVDTNEQYKSYLPHTRMANEFMLRLLDKAGLW